MIGPETFWVDSRGCKSCSYAKGDIADESGRATRIVRPVVNTQARADRQGGGSYVPYGLDGNDDPNRPSTPAQYPKMCYGELIHSSTD
jgi:hypothetical protein